MSRIHVKGGRQVQQQPECVVRGALALTLHASRWLGVAPLRMEYAHGEWRISVSRALTSYGYVLLLGLHIALLYSLVIDFTVPSEKSVRAPTAVLGFVWIIMLVLVGSIASTGVINAPNRMKLMIDYMYQLDNVHKKFCMTKKWQPDESKKVLAAVLIILMTCALFALESAAFALNAIYQDKELKLVFYYICFYLEYLMVLLLEMQFVFVGFTIESSLRYINRSLKYFIYVDDMMIKSKPYTSISGCLGIMLPIPKLDKVASLADNTKNDRFEELFLTVKKNLPSIKSYGVSYAVVCSALKQVTGSFESVTILLISSIFVQLLIAVYSNIFATSLYDSGGFDKASKILFLIWQIFILFLLTEPCHKIKIQVQKLQFLLSHIFRRLNTADSRCQELHFLYEQVSVDQLAFFISGMCKLRRALGLVMFSGVFTYITFIVQFQLSE